MSEENATSQPKPETVQGTAIFYNKSNYFRVVHVTGMYGGGTPVPGELLMTVFNDRVPLPEKTVNDASGKEILQARVAKQGLERELEAALVMNLATAKIMHEWLGRAIDTIERIQKPVG